MFKYLATVLFLFLFSIQVFSQEYPVKIFTTNDGLSQMQVLTVFKDSRGYIWAGTKFGISKYNGERFTNYRPIEGVMGMEINEFAEDYTGNLFINSLEGISRFDGKDFTPIKHLRTEHGSMTIGPDNKLYALIDNKITRLNAKDSLEELKWPSLKNKKFRTIKFEKGKKELLAIIDSVGLVEVSQNNIKNLFPSKSLQIYLRFAENGQRIIIENDGDLYNYWYQTKQNNWMKFLQIKGKNINILNQTPFDFPFIFESNAYILIAKSNKYQLISKDIIMPNIDNYSAYVKNGFYMASELGLVYVINNGFKYFKKEDVPYAWSVSEDKFGDKWIWNYGYPTTKWNGNKLEKVTGYLKSIQTSLDKNFKELNSVAGDWWYFGSLKDKYGNLWQSHGSGVLHYDYKKFELFSFKPIQRTISFALLEDSTKNLVLSGSYKSVEVFENKPPYKSSTLDAKNGLNVGTYVLCMALEAPGIYWFGGGNMLARYDSYKKKWKEFSKKNGKIDSRIFLDMCFDSHKTLWVASVENGLYYYNKNLDSLIKFPHYEFRDPVNFVGEIDPDHLMVGTSRQVCVIDLKAWYNNKQIYLKTYNHHNGYMGMETGQSGFFKDSKGEIWLTSGTILSVIDPKKLDLKPDSLHTYFTKFNRETLPFNISNLVLQSGGEARIEFESVGENKSVESQYSYKLDDEAWSAWQTEPVVTFSKLASGRYKLMVRSRTGNGDLSFSKPAELYFKVSVLPWQSPYFPIYSLMALIGGGGLFMYYRARQKTKDIKDKIHRAKQEQLLQKKELDLQSQSLKVQALQVQTAQAQMNPHFTFNVLYAMQNLIYGHDTKAANDNLLKLSKLMRSYLDASIKSEIDPNEPEKGMITLDKEIELLQMYIDFEKLKYQEAFDGQITVASNISTDFYKLPPLLIQPFVENAIIHGVIPNSHIKGKVQINFDLDNDENLVCTITDNGIGRHEAQKRKETQVASHISRGTELVSKRVEILNQLGIKINIKTLDNRPTGTQVIIKIEP